MTTTTASPPTATAPPTPPPGVPAHRWTAAVALVREQARTVTHFWPLWSVAYRKFLRGYSDGGTFYMLFDQYKEAGGVGSTYDRDAGPDAGQDARTASSPASWVSGDGDDVAAAAAGTVDREGNQP